MDAEKTRMIDRMGLKDYIFVTGASGIGKTTLGESIGAMKERTDI